MARVRDHQRGFTLFEVTLVTAILGGLMALVGNSLRVTDSLSKDAIVVTKAHSEHRRSFEAIANVLREADLSTLQGFTETGDPSTPVRSSIRPYFQRVVGSDSAERTLGNSEELRWQHSGEVVAGVPLPGNVFLYQLDADGVPLPDPLLLARRVPSGGFELRQEGRTLVMRLTTYSVTGNEAVKLISQSALSARN